MEVHQGGNVYRGRQSVRKALGGQEYPRLALVTMSRERAPGRGLTIVGKPDKGIDTNWTRMAALSSL